MSDTNTVADTGPNDFGLDPGDPFPMGEVDTKPRNLTGECEGACCSDEGIYRAEIGEYLCDDCYGSVPMIEDMKPKE